MRPSNANDTFVMAVKWPGKTFVFGECGGKYSVFAISIHEADLVCGFECFFFFFFCYEKCKLMLLHNEDQGCDSYLSEKLTRHQINSQHL